MTSCHMNAPGGGGGALKLSYERGGDAYRLPY